MTLLCKYKDIFGKPNEGAHQYRFLGTAIVDVLGTMLLAYGTTVYFGQEKMPYWKSLLLWLTVAEMAHLAFCVDTAWLKALRS